MASSSQGSGGELILAAPHGRPITAYDALTGDVVAEFPAANTPRHGLAAATGPGTASHVQSFFTDRNWSGNRGNRSNWSEPIPVSAGFKPAQI